MAKQLKLSKVFEPYTLILTIIVVALIAYFVSRWRTTEHFAFGPNVSNAELAKYGKSPFAPKTKSPPPALPPPRFLHNPNKPVHKLPPIVKIDCRLNPEKCAGVIY